MISWRSKNKTFTSPYVIWRHVEQQTGPRMEEWEHVIQTEINGMLQFEVQRARDPITDKNLMTRVVEKEKRVCTVSTLHGSRLIGWEFQLRMDFGVIESAFHSTISLIMPKEIKQKELFFIFSQLHLLKIVLREPGKKEHHKQVFCGLKENIVKKEKWTVIARRRESLRIGRQNTTVLRFVLRRKEM